MRASCPEWAPSCPIRPRKQLCLRAEALEQRWNSCPARAAAPFRPPDRTSRRHSRGSPGRESRYSGHHDSQRSPGHVSLHGPRSPGGRRVVDRGDRALTLGPDQPNFSSPRSLRPDTREHRVRRRTEKERGGPDRVARPPRSRRTASPGWRSIRTRSLVFGARPQDGSEGPSKGGVTAGDRDLPDNPARADDEARADEGKPGAD